MQIDKILNHNCVIVKDDNQREMVVMGNGIAFGKKVKERIDPNLIKKVFFTENSGMTKKISNIASNLPVEYVKVTDEIVNKMRRKYQIEIDDLVYLSIGDHIAFAIQRINEGVTLNANFLWEVKNLFPKEYQCGLLALEIIKERLKVELPEDEAGFIAIHIINATKVNGKVTFNKITKLVQAMLHIIEKYIPTKLDQNSINYQRLLTHLRFLASRILDSKVSDIPEIYNDLYNTFTEIYAGNLKCIEEISQLLLKDYEYHINNDEKLYLSIHLQRAIKV